MTKMGLNDYDSFLIELFKDPSKMYFGDQLKELLVSAFDLSDSNARQIVNRAARKGFIRSSYPLSFGRNTHAYFSPLKRLSFDDYLLLTADRRPPLYRILAAIKACGGVISYFEAIKIASTPLSRTASKVSTLDELLGELSEIGLVELRTDGRGVKYVADKSIGKELIDAAMDIQYSRMVVDAAFIYDVLGRLIAFNLIDNQDVIYRNRRTPSLGARHNNYLWDAYAYSKTTGINTVYGSNAAVVSKAALVVMDMVISRPYSDFDLDGFFARIQVQLNNTSKMRKLVPVIVFGEIESEVLNRARALGILTCSMYAFFGNEIGYIIGNVGRLKLAESNPVSVAPNALKVIDDTLKHIAKSGNEVNLQHLMGDFFQSLMFQLLFALYPGASIEQFKKLPANDGEADNRKEYEYDFIINSSRTNEIIFVDARGYKPGYLFSLDGGQAWNTLRLFFEEAYISGKSHYRAEAFRDYQVRSVFITSARFDNDAIIFLNKLNMGEQKPSGINVAYDGVALLKLADRAGLPLLKKILGRYFIN